MESSQTEHYKHIVCVWLMIEGNSEIGGVQRQFL